MGATIIMRLLDFLVLLLGWTIMSTATAAPFAIIIHGGAGTITRDKLTENKAREIRQTLARAVNAGYQVLEQGGRAEDAVTAAIVVMEDSPLFNAGKGAVFTADGRHELDASLMRGQDLQAGAVAAVRHTRNPILAAQAVMEHSPHVMLAGDGADQFAREQGLEQVENSWFDTPYRKAQWQKARQTASQSLSEELLDDAGLHKDDKFGTVGAVALDQHGHLAAGTSTGGMTNKHYGRVGDSPIIGAGTYADDRSCAVSATGHGEFFIRYTVAHDICARVRYRKESLEQAAEQVIMQALKAVHGEGGIIALDKQGKPVAVFNTAGMYRGWRTSQQAAAVTGIYEAGDER